MWLAQYQGVTFGSFRATGKTLYVYAMRYNKPATSIDQQIDKLVERGMRWDDQDLVRRWLSTVGYYRLSAYWLPYEEIANKDQIRSRKFIPDSKFEDIVDLYVFDRKLRLIVTEAIERIEIALRARWINRFTLAHGAHGHLDYRNFSATYQFSDLLAKLARRSRDSNETMVKHYHQKYDSPKMPPLWVTTELMTFGELSHWFVAGKDPKLKSALAKELGLPSREILESVIEFLSYIRNICAHHGRLWNKRTVKRLPKIKKLSENLAFHEKDGQKQTVNLIYNVLVILIHMLRHQSPDTSFPDRLKKLIHTRNDWQLEAMGFPKDWQTRPCWQ